MKVKIFFTSALTKYVIIRGRGSVFESVAPSLCRTERPQFESRFDLQIFVSTLISPRTVTGCAHILTIRCPKGPRVQ